MSIDGSFWKLYAKIPMSCFPHRWNAQTIAARPDGGPNKTIPAFLLTIGLRFLDALLLQLRSQPKAAASPEDLKGKPAYKISVHE